MNHHARLWGRKAAREGLPLTSNPYRALSDRIAWTQGHNEERAELAQIERKA